MQPIQIDVSPIGDSWNDIFGKLDAKMLASIRKHPKSINFGYMEKVFLG
jgi:hypothetical protein